MVGIRRLCRIPSFKLFAEGSNRKLGSCFNLLPCCFLQPVFESGHTWVSHLCPEKIWLIDIFCLFLHWNPLYGHQYITDGFVVQRVTNSHVSLIPRYGQFICTLSMTEYLTGDNLTHFCFSLYIDKICDGDVFSESPLSTDTMACFLGVRINQVSIFHF